MIEEGYAVAKSVTHIRTMKDLAGERLAAISRLFSSSVVREMARKGESPLFARLAGQSLLRSSLSEGGLVHDLFDAAFELLKREGYRDEYVYKAALTHKILLGRHSLKTASTLNEFRVGDCKADLAILNGTATVYEVKSERDSLTRLDRQLIAYSTVFAQVYVIAAENHVDAVVSSVPQHVGILRLNNRLQIATLREAVDRSDCVSPTAIFDSIRTDEARMILLSQGVSVPVVPNTELNSALRQIFATLAPAQAHNGMVQVLRKTRNLLRLADLVDRLPYSLQPAALSVPLRKQDHERLVSAVNTRLEVAMAWN